MVTAGDTLGAYRIMSLLGAGGMGEVWLAEHTLLQHRVAIKILRPALAERSDLVDRFFDEARAAARIADPGIAAVHDFGSGDAGAYIVMELLVGETLAARIVRMQRFTFDVAARFGQQIAMTMAAAHRRGIVHRDLKPDNIVLVADPAAIGGERVKILDFGIAKDREHEHATQTGVFLGTPMYMSPEQCRDPRNVDPRSDVYALGCILFAMLCGRAPFVGDPGDVIAAHLLDAPPLPSDFGDSPLLDDVIARCLAKSPSDRYESMHEVARALAPITGIRVPTVEQPSAGDVALLTTLGSQIPVRSRRRLRAFVEPVAVVFALVALVASAPPLADAIVPTIVGPVTPESALVVELATAMRDPSPPAPRVRPRAQPNDLYDSRGN